MAEIENTAPRTPYAALGLSGETTEGMAYLNITAAPAYIPPMRNWSTARSRKVPAQVRRR